MNKTAKIQKIYPLTPMQEGMLFHSLIDNESKAYYYQLFFSINKTLDIMLFEKSFNFLIKRYDILRTSFVYQKIQQPRQVVLKERHANIYFEDISQLKDDEKVLFIEEFKRKDMEKGFDLTKDILIRISIIQTGKETYKIIWSHHHILMDAWCIAIIIEEFFTIYQSLKENKPLKLEAVYPYSSYIKWLVKQDKEEAALYWKEYLKDYQQQAVLPKQGGMAVKKGYKREKISFVIDEELTKGLEAVAKENHVTLGTTFQTIWGILLQKYNNTDDVVFGSVVSGRPHKVAGIEKMVGLFINTIPVRIKCNTIKSFSFLLKQVQESLLSSKKYDFLPLYEIQSNSLLKHDVFSQIMSFTYYNFEREFQNLKGKQDLEFTIDDVEVFDQTHYDLNIIAVPDSELAVIFIYNALVYDRNFLKKIEGNFKEIAKSVVKDHDVLIKHIEILTKEEKNQIIYEFNNTEADYQKEKTIQEMFEEQVEKTPDNVAVVCEDKKLTYRELNVKANQIARILRKKGIGPDSIEGIMTERSLEMITGIMGILKAGGAYLPIDPEYPAERIKYMLEDSGTFVLLTTKSTARDFPFYLLQSAGRNAVEPIATCIRPQIKDLDSIPIPDRSLVDYEKYNRYIGQAMVKHAMSIQATRGCPYQCAYCHKIWPKNHVVRTAENIFRELKMYYDIGIRRFAFIDDIFNLNVENSSRLFKLIIQNGLKVHIFFPNGVRGDILIKEYMDLMVRAGVVNVAFALETASPRLQKLIKKNINLEKLKENIEYLTAKYPHVITELFSMHGFPTETEEEANMTLDFIKSIKWLHFPYVHILKIYPDTDMAKLAVGNGVSKEAIERSADLAYHELPDTLPFSKGFTRKYQAEFLNEYFLSKERLLKVLPLQMKIMTEAELVQKYNSYLPAEIKCFDDLLSLAGISRVELAAKESVKEDDIAIQNLNEKIRRNFPAQKYKEGSLRIFLLDLSQFFSDDKRNMLYGLVEPPLGLMYLMTYLNKEFGEKVFGKIAKSYVDFDSYEELKVLIEDFKPHVIGIRTLTYYRNFLHETVSALRQWGVNVPIIAGGPYATSSYAALLKDRNIDLVVLGEGEITLSEVMGKIIENGGKLPDDGVLRKIPGIAYVENKEKLPQEAFNREVILLDELPAGIDKGSENLDNINTPYNLAYVIYTSGTTGKPKGTM
ncbi:MAG: AMP-binding protein, partial [Ruminiclostridium sp.]|nr:AMP-binding protein [Ruminiclostridium sp.]